MGHSVTKFDESRQNVIRGKNLVGQVSKGDVAFLLGQLHAMERWLDDRETDDRFGTEGWHHDFEMYLRDEEDNF